MLRLREDSPVFDPFIDKKEAHPKDSDKVEDIQKGQEGAAQFVTNNLPIDKLKEFEGK